MTPPTLHCKTRAEFMRVSKWLCASKIAHTMRGLEIEIGTTGDMPGQPTLETFQAAQDLQDALSKLLTAAVAAPIHVRKHPPFAEAENLADEALAKSRRSS